MRSSSVQRNSTLARCAIVGSLASSEVRMALPTRSWIQTYTGRAFDPVNPDANDVYIADIAHALANLCRFTGHAQRFISVAQHSVLVSEVVPASDALWGLLHDAPEAYLGDLSMPIKRHSDLGTAYCLVEAKLMAAICSRFGLPVEQPHSVDVADRRVLMTEKRDLLGPEPLPWPHTDPPFPWHITSWHPERAERLFLKRYDAIVCT